MDLYFYILIGSNIILPLFLAFYFYMTRSSRDAKESLYAILVLIFWTIRFIWLLIRSFEIYFDLLNRFVSLVFSLTMIFALLWLKKFFPEDSEKITGRMINYFHILSLIMISGLLVPLSIFLPSDKVKNDINANIDILMLVFTAVILLEIIFRFVHRVKSFQLQYITYYNFGILVGLLLIIAGGTIFYRFVYDVVLMYLSPMIGFMIIFGSIIAVRILPFVLFARTVDTGIIIVTTKDELVEYINKTAKDYISPKLLNKQSSISFYNIWPENKRIKDGFDRTDKEKRTFQVEARIRNYAMNKHQNIQFTFYPLHSEPILDKIGIMLMNSDEIEFLKQRKDFLIDIVTHDLANVSQTLSLALEPIKYDDLKSLYVWELLELAKCQTHRLERLVFSTQNLLYIDDIATSPEEIFHDFNKRFMEFIEEKRNDYPKLVIKADGIDDLKGIKTTGNLRAGFDLLIDSIIDSLKGAQKKINITAQIDNDLLEQKIVFKFEGKEISSKLFENYLEENKSAIVSASSTRVNLIVGSAIIQANGGRIMIDKDIDFDFTEIIITLPIYE